MSYTVDRLAVTRPLQSHPRNSKVTAFNTLDYINQKSPPPTLSNVLVTGNVASTGINMNNSSITNATLTSATRFVGDLSGNITTATTATSIAGGTGGSIPYQSASGTTSFVANGAPGQVLTSQGNLLSPQWTTLPTPATPSLSSVLTTGNIASVAIDMSGSNISNAGQVQAGSVSIATPTDTNSQVTTGSTYIHKDSGGNTLSNVFISNTGVVSVLENYTPTVPTSLAQTQATTSSSSAYVATQVYTTSTSTSTTLQNVGAVENDGDLSNDPYASRPRLHLYNYRVNASYTNRTNEILVYPDELSMSLSASNDYTFNFNGTPKPTFKNSGTSVFDGTATYASQTTVTDAPPISTSYYLPFTTATTGNLSLYVDSTILSYNPTTNLLQVSGLQLSTATNASTYSLSTTTLTIDCSSSSNREFSLAITGTISTLNLTSRRVNSVYKICTTNSSGSSQTINSSLGTTVSQPSKTSYSTPTTISVGDTWVMTTKVLTFAGTNYNCVSLEKFV